MVHDRLVRLDAVSMVFPGGVRGLDTVDLDIAEGEFLSLLGPSGCGKTTSLRVIAGFEEPTHGRVLLDGRDITRLKPHERPVNTVFQDYALFPHMNVAENVGFGLTLRRLDTAAIRRKVADALEMVGLSDKIGARVSALSGGQRQRVALARAIVCEPRVLLLDEPLSALDAHLREQMQIELKRLQATLRTTFVMVTHDQTEALSISDRIVVMNRGRIEQIASPATLYDMPATRFVASFIGTMNVLDCRLVERRSGELLVAAGPLAFVASGDDVMQPADSMLAVGVRPEDVLIDEEARDGTATARLIETVFHGRALRLHAQLSDGTPLTIDTPRRGARTNLAAGDVVHVRVREGTARALSG
jgi:spermidine/putrescine transport system ATP-binding protein